MSIPRTNPNTWLFLIALLIPWFAGTTLAAEPPAARLSFDLPDACGRQVLSADYAGQVVLVTCGSAWCGGCQQDACALPEVIAQYASKGLRIIHAMAGDSELNALEFQKHYRLGIVHLLDADRLFEKRYNPDGWPFTMLFGPDGQLLYQKNDSLDRMTDDLAPRIEKALAQVTAKVQPIVRDGIPYMPATLKRTDEQQTAHIYDRYPSIACGPDGRAYAAFTSNRTGNSDVFLRTYDGKAWSKDISLAASPDDEFDASVFVDRAGKVWLTWTSNARGDKYNIFCTTLDSAGKPAAPQQLTDADDDAMHARMTCDAAGHIWVTYYKWALLNGLSRDREIYVRRNDGKAWSDEIHVSPEDVPDYEDHCEPVVLPWRDGVAVAWSWDFHQPKGYPHSLQDPTVFARTLGPDLRLGQITAIGDQHIDEAPAIAPAPQGQLCCAWTASVWQNAQHANRKVLFVRSSDLSTMTPAGKPLQLSTPCANLCTPTLAAAPNSTLNLFWSEQPAVNGPWVLKRADCQAGQWPTPQAVESQGNPRFPCAAYDAQGNLWLVYTQQVQQDRQVICRKIPQAPTRNHAQAAAPLDTPR